VRARLPPKQCVDAPATVEPYGDPGALEEVDERDDLLL
jgi:hypothetical protein